MTRLFVLLLSLISGLAYSAPESDLWPFWNKSNEQNSQTVSHQKWQSFLDTYLVQQNEYTLVNYKSVTTQDKQSLKSYISDLAALNPKSLNKAEQYAYWVNLYNALTVDLILDNYPVSSITKLGGFFSFGPWGQEIIDIQGKTLTLNDIEHRILRPIWNDPRTHYAVNCASLGCPNLQSSAFTAENYNQLLDKAASEFINAKKGVSVNGGKTQLSSIYDWFAVDFGGEKQVINHLKKYRDDLPASLGKVSFDYDWSLNETQ